MRSHNNVAGEMFQECADMSAHTTAGNFQRKIFDDYVLFLKIGQIHALSNLCSLKFPASVDIMT